MQFDNPIGWYAFASLIILLLLYLIRPRPRDKQVSSLMFFIKDKGFLRHSMLLRKILNNLLLLLQLAAILLLCFSIMEPFTMINANAASENTIIVLDGSASMQTKDGGSTRFEKAVEIAKQKLGGKVTLIFATSMPLVLLEKGSSSDAKSILSNINAQDTPTNIGDAMLAAINIVNGEKGIVYVLSDFKYTDGPDPIAAKRALLASNLQVEFINLASKASNTGIIDLKVSHLDTEVTIKNYNDEPTGISLQAGGQTLNKLVPGNSVETLAFETPQGITELKLQPSDDFMADNKAFISAPDSTKTNVLLVTNAEKSNLKTALSSARDIKLTVSKPPVVPNFNYDVIIVDRVDVQYMLPGFYTDISKQVKDGKNLIVTAQDAMPSFSILPVKVGAKQESSASVIFTETSFTKHIVTRHLVSKYYLAEPKEGAAIVAASENNVLLIAVSTSGLGTVVYYGLFDDASTFKTSTDYPIFWDALINYLMKRENLADFNFKTGSTVIVDEQQVGTPDGTIKTDRVSFSRVGKYNFDGKNAVASLLNAKESEVTGEESELKAEDAQLIIEGKTEQEKKGFEMLLAGLAALALIAELILLKYRGDL
jgi:hypothetical protein